MNEESMIINPTNVISVLLVCPPGLEQVSLYTSISAIPHATIIAKASGVVSALQLMQQHNPDVLLVDANILQGETTQLLKRIKELRSKVIRVVFVATRSQGRHLQQEGADYVLNYSNLNQLFPQILHSVQAKRQGHFHQKQPATNND